jgi:hypothetical protein
MTVGITLQGQAPCGLPGQVRLADIGVFCQQQFDQAGVEA